MRGLDLGVEPFRIKTLVRTPGDHEISCTGIFVCGPLQFMCSCFFLQLQLSLQYDSWRGGERVGLHPSTHQEDLAPSRFAAFYSPFPH